MKEFMIWLPCKAIQGDTETGIDFLADSQSQSSHSSSATLTYGECAWTWMSTYPMSAIIIHGLVMYAVRHTAYLRGLSFTSKHPGNVWGQRYCFLIGFSKTQLRIMFLKDEDTEAISDGICCIIVPPDTLSFFDASKRHSYWSSYL